MTNPIREFSAQVTIDLILDGATLPVRQSGGDFIIMSHPFPIEPRLATLVLTVDGQVTNFKIYLTEGVRPDRDEQPMVIISSDEAAA